jgi:hypothetical protein
MHSIKKEQKHPRKPEICATIYRENIPALKIRMETIVNLYLAVPR